MATLTKDRDTREIRGNVAGFFVASGKEIFAGAITAIDIAGYAVAADDKTAVKTIGRAEHYAKDGQAILVKRGQFLWDNDSSDPVTQADVDSYCYVSDDQTVQKTAGTIIAGLIRGVTSEGVYVDTKMNPDGATAGEAAAAAAVGDLIETAIDDDLNDPDSKIKTAVGALIDDAIDAEGNARLVTAPDSETAAGTKGDIAYDNVYIYLCIAEDTWIRSALAKDDTWTT